MFKEIKREILISVIVTAIFLVLINPISNLIWKTVMTVGGNAHNEYVDMIYRRAAEGDNFQSRIILGILFFILGGLAGAFTFLILFLTNRKRENSIRKETWLSNLGEKRWILKTGGGMAIVLIYGIGAFFLFNSSISSGIVEITSSFNQRLMVLSPEISDHEYKRFLARWAQMRGRNDYDSIVSDMNTKAKELNVKLPPLRQP